MVADCVPYRKFVSSQGKQINPVSLAIAENEGTMSRSSICDLSSLYRFTTNNINQTDRKKDKKLSLKLRLCQNTKNDQQNGTDAPSQVTAYGLFSD